MSWLIDFSKKVIALLNDFLYTPEQFRLSFVFITIIVFVVVHICFSKSKKPHNSPPGPICVPILGYLPFLSKEPFRDFDRLSKIYGNVFSLYLGKNYVVILADNEAVKDAFSKATTLDRPERLFDFLPDGVGISSLNGNIWAEQRKYTVKAMRNLGLGTSEWENLIQEEAENLKDLVKNYNGKPTDIQGILTASVWNNMSLLIFGKKMPVNDENVKFICRTLEKIFLFASQTNWRAFFPFLFDVLVACGLTGSSTIHKEFEEFSSYIKNEIKLIKENHVPGSTDNFVDGYLTEMEKQNEKHQIHSFNESNLRGNVQALFLGGTDTTRTSLYWLMLCMAEFPEIQDKVHDELVSVLGKDGKITWSEKSTVPYTFAVIMEGQRYRTVAPLNTSRVAIENIRIGKYDIPKGTTIIANNWGLHNDERYWKNPDKFIPGRFLSNDGKLIASKIESYVPFSYGKRSCPGETVALIEILYYFVTFMRNFQIVPPGKESVEMNGTLGLTYQVTPQKLRFIPRK